MGPPSLLTWKANGERIDTIPIGWARTLQDAQGQDDLCCHSVVRAAGGVRCCGHDFNQRGRSPCRKRSTGPQIRRDGDPEECVQRILGGGKGAVKYADKVALMGQNGKYLLTTYSGKVVCRASVIAQDSVFQIDGGSGPVMLGDVVMFKSEYGFLHAQPGGATAMDMTPNTLAKFTLGMPGQENGLREARGLMYGDVVKFKNTDGDYLLLNRNGWFQLQGNGANPMENCVILSMQHREGHISYGDPIMLRGHNGRFITTSLGGRLEAVSRAWTDFAQFKFYGTLGSSSGYVHSRDEVMLKGARGFVDSVSNGGAEHVTADGTDRANSKWIVQKVWTSKI